MESSLLASNSAGGRERLIRELMRGRRFTHQLQLVLQNAQSDVDGDGGSDLSMSAQVLVNKILDSFNETLSTLASASAGDGEDDEVSQVPAAVDSPRLDGRKAEDSGESCRTSVRKDRRGCYKRTRTSETVVKESSTWIDDGQAWRKYGQKSILNAAHPRNYFRCTHKYDQGCQATKHVQKIKDDPPKYRTTYQGHHTCKNLYKSSQIIIMDATARDSSKVIWNFESQKSDNYEPHDPLTLPIVKYENKEQDQDLPNNIQSVPSDYFISVDDFTAFGSSDDHGDVISSDVYSCTASTRSLEMDMMVGSMFDDDFLDI